MKFLVPLLVLAGILANALQKAGSSSVVPDRVEVILYTDFQCPYCGKFAEAFRELQARGVEGVQTTVRFKHFPLSIHPRAPLAHQAALAAAEQGKFWEMHDLLFANQSAVAPVDLAEYAKRLSLDLDRFKKDLESERVKQIIEADLAEGNRLRVQGTPTFFVNEKRFSGAMSFDQLKRLILREHQGMKAIAEVSDESLSRGSADSPVIIEFFADLQSPVSRPALEVLDRALEKYPSRIRIQFRNFPLTFHPQSRLAHEAAMVAAVEGRFWDFARHVLDHQDSVREQDLIAQAGRFGLNQEKFSQSLSQHRYAARVEKDLETGARRGVRGSPVIFVNGARIDGVPSLDRLLENIDAALSAISKSEPRR